MVFGGPLVLEFSGGILRALLFPPAVRARENAETDEPAIRVYLV
jgi:hypothetical protein